MALELANTAEIMAAYNAVLANELNWFLLHYPKHIVDELALYAFGSNGIEELKTKIDPSDNEQALVGFVRVEDDDIPTAALSVPSAVDETEEEDSVKYVLVNYVPGGIMGVRRARTKVHARRLGMIFKKHDAVLTIETVSQLTNAAIAQILAEPHHSLLTFSSTAPGPGSAGAETDSPATSSAPPFSFSPPFDSLLTAAGPPSNDYSAPPVLSQPPHQSQSQSQPLVAPDIMGRSFSQPVQPTNTGITITTTTTTANNIKTSNPRGSLLGLPSLKPIRKSFSDHTNTSTNNPSLTINTTTGPAKTGNGNVFSQFLRRKKRPGSTTAIAGGVIGAGPATGRGAHGEVFDESQESDDSMPPPTPPKDKGIYACAGPGMHILEGSNAKSGSGSEREDNLYRHRGAINGGGDFMYPPYSHSSQHPHPQTHELGESSFPPPELPPISESSFRHLHSISEFAVISHEELNGGRRSNGDDMMDVVVISPDEFARYGGSKPLPQHNKIEVGISTYKKGKWAEPQGLSAIRDPGERARVRMEMQKQKDEEDQELARAEEERQERIRRKKEELMRREEEEAERRKAAIQAEAVRVATERRRREEEEKQEEEQKAREREERKKSERAKRIEEHLKLEEWRKEQQKMAEEAVMREKEAERREEEERMMKISKAEKHAKQKAKEGAMTGYVTIQTDDSVVWRRRYYKFSPNTFYFYRNVKELGQTSDKLDVRGVVRALKEPKEGYQDLEAIPFSFAIEFHDRGPWSVYADSEEEKFKLLGLLKYAAGLS